MTVDDDLPGLAPSVLRRPIPAMLTFALTPSLILIT